MGSISLDAILHRARALCAESGLDPDLPGRDGKPGWFGFISQARASIRRDQQAQDPLAQLRAIDAAERESETPQARAAESFDPLEKLQALYEAEMGGGARASSQQDQQVSLPELKDFSRDSDDARTHSREQTDPVAELKALEAAQAAWRPDPPDEDDDPGFGLPE